MQMDPNAWLAARKRREAGVQDGLRLARTVSPDAEELFSPAAFHLLARIERRFREQRRLLRAGRDDRAFRAGLRPLPDGDWRVSAPPESFQNAPLYQELPATDAGFARLAPFVPAWFDLRDAVAPTWERIQRAHVLLDDHFTESFVPYNTVLRPRAWTRDEDALTIDGRAPSAAAFDLALFLFHHAERLGELGGITLALGDLTNRLEARWWASLLDFVEEDLGLPVGTIRVAVEVDSVAALRELDGILRELRLRATMVAADRARLLASAVTRWNELGRPPAPEHGVLRSNRRALRAYAQLLLRIAERRGVLAVAAPLEDRASRHADHADELALDLADGFASLRVRTPAGLAAAREVLEGPRPPRRSSVVRWSDLDETPRGALTSAGVERVLHTVLRQTAAWLHGSGELRLGERSEHGASLLLGATQLAAWCDQHARTLEGHRLDHASLEASLRGLLARMRVRLGVEAYAQSHFDRAAWLLLNWLGRDAARRPGYDDVLARALPGNGLDLDALRTTGA